MPCLRDHAAGTLTALDRYLHERPGGMSGALSHAIRGAAIDAVLSGTEKITKESLAVVPLDCASETHGTAPQIVR
ncbi:hypothetical protein ACFYZ6_30315 [Streptomyces rubiginosohelvolus]|uniref:hypothetical protein n=1 Tax=Streptomyces rubiginosohelvolus TaxID=67362 RepID=UPI0036C3B7F2